MPVLLVRSNRLAKRVQLVHIRIQLRGDIEAVVVQFREFQTQVNLEITPVHGVRREVIASVNRKVINQAHYLIRLFTCRIFRVDDFHLQVVLHAEGQRRGCPLRRIAVRAVRKARIGLFDYFAGRHTLACRIQRVFVINRLVVRSVITPERLPEIRVIRYTESRRQHMADFLYLAVRE